MDKYSEEARQKWGHTDAYKQSQKRVKKMGKAGLHKVLEESQKLTREIALQMKKGEGPLSLKVQLLIAKHYNNLRAFYDPGPEIYRGLAELYISDPRFKANYEKVAKGLAQFMHDAMIHFVGEKENN
jgi:hypothetical protein